MALTKKYPRITVVTPNYNQGDYIEETINSVLNQNYPNLEYIIIDGGSTDQSLDIIKKYEKDLAYWNSEPDGGMYYAINKGFLKATGDIMCWINSDDILWENSLFSVANIFSSNPNIHWLQGRPTMIDKNNNVIVQKEYFFSKFYFYFLEYEKTFSFIQQESSFWSKTLWDKAGGYLNTSFKISADFDLWLRFFELEKMYCTKEHLGAFREREGQKSGDRKQYLNETKESLLLNFKKLSVFEKAMVKLMKLLSSINTLFQNKYLSKIFNKLIKIIIGKPKFVE
ncbi:glycosyltransferase family 2 protein [Litoribaculum gwangyangense]|uniref:Glycosyltransferase 2-like domain-containing protein n=1 Tax=Litoribaculum gwangyangense TaxID=1130722 RepID=A0ABP9CQ76_9FLAO